MLTPGSRGALQVIEICPLVGFASRLPRAVAVLQSSRGLQPYFARPPVDPDWIDDANVGVLAFNCALHTAVASL